MDFQGNKLAANLCDDESPDTSDLTRDRETWRKFRLERQRFTNTARARMQSEETASSRPRNNDADAGSLYRRLIGIFLSGKIDGTSRRNDLDRIEKFDSKITRLVKSDRRPVRSTLTDTYNSAI